MKKKGFTLIEILGVIVIIGLLLLLVAPAITNRISGNKDKVKSATDEIVFNAVFQHINENKRQYPNGRSYCIKVSDLINEGKLVSPVKDVATNKVLDNYSVFVTIYNGGNMDYQIMDESECEDAKEVPSIEIKILNSGSAWSESKEVQIIYPEVGKGTYYEKEGSNYKYQTPNEINDNYDIKEGLVKQLTVTESGTVHAEMMYGDKKIVKEKTISITKDNTPPNCDETEWTGESTTWTKENRTITVTAKDEEGGSGIDENYKTQSWTYSSTTKTASLSYTIKDKAGNETTCTKTVNVYVDKTAPSVPTVKLYKWKDNNTRPTSASGLAGYTNGSWSNLKVFTIASGSTDSGGGGIYYQYTTTGKTTNSTNTKATYRNIEAQGVSYIKYRACDSLGNCSNYTSNYTIKIDTGNPTISTISHSGVSATISATCTDSVSGVKKSTVSTTATGNKTQTLTLTCEDNAGNKASRSRKMTYSTCASGSNTCKYGCSTCSRQEAYSCQKRVCVTGLDETGCGHALEGKYCCGYRTSTCYRTVSYNCNCSNCKTGSNTCRAGYK